MFSTEASALDFEIPQRFAQPVAVGSKSDNLVAHCGELHKKSLYILCSYARAIFHLAYPCDAIGIRRIIQHLLKRLTRH